MKSKIGAEKQSKTGRDIGVGAGPVGPVLTGPLFRKKLVGVTIINTRACLCVEQQYAAT